MKTKEELAEEKYPYLPNGCNFTVENTHDDLRSIERCAFIAGYEAAQQWIDVAFELPPAGENVLLKIEGYDCIVGFYTHAQKYRAALFNPIGIENIEVKNVTHWLPLPELLTIKKSTE